MASVIEDVSSLPGETVHDQDGRKIGEVKDIYAVGEDETPMWVSVESSTGIGRSRQLFIPLARLKQQGDEIRTPYSYQHIHEAPEVEEGDELSEEDDRALRDYYSIGLADQEMVDNPQSYASQVPDEEEPAKKVEASSVEGPVREIEDKPPGERAREIDEAEREKGDKDDKARKATADDVLGDNDDDSKSDDDSNSQADSKSESDSKREADSESEAGSKSEPDSKDEGDSEEEDG